MDVKIKDFNVDMAIKNNGIEIDVNDGTEHLGDLYVTKANVIWCKGKTKRENGVKLSWKKFAELMEASSV